MYFIIDAQFYQRNSSESSVLDVFGVEAKRNSNSPDEELKLISIATKDVCDNDIVSDVLSCEARGNDTVKSFTQERLEEKNTGFFCPNKEKQV